MRAFHMSSEWNPSKPIKSHAFAGGLDSHVWHYSYLFELLSRTSCQVNVYVIFSIVSYSTKCSTVVFVQQFVYSPTLLWMICFRFLTVNQKLRQMFDGDRTSEPHALTSGQPESSADDLSASLAALPGHTA